MRPSFPGFFFAKLAELPANPGLNDPRHETHIIVTYHYETLFDAHKTKISTIGLAVIEFEVNTLKMQNRKQDFLDIFFRVTI